VQARDLWAVALITLGVLLMLALWGQQLGPVGHGADSALALLAGWTRVLLPLVSVGAGVALLVDRGARIAGDTDEDAQDATPPGADPWRLAVGIVLGLLGICGLAELAKGAPKLSGSHALRDAGGYLGALVGRPLHSGLGSAGAVVLLVALVLVAILIATGVSLATLGRGVHAAGAATARTTASLWRGKPFVVLPNATAAGEDGEPTSSDRAAIVPEADASPDDHPSRKLRSRRPPCPRLLSGPPANGSSRRFRSCTQRRSCAWTSDRWTQPEMSWCGRSRRTGWTPGWWGAGSGRP
jgi:S-DNA-T family DNA segregation ATPase FtsK/SpoIIIE